jgi:hypothetical protein
LDLHFLYLNPQFLPHGKFISFFIIGYRLGIVGTFLYVQKSQILFLITLINQQWPTFFPAFALISFPDLPTICFRLYCSPPSPSWSSSSTLPFEVPLTAFSIPRVGKRKWLLVNGSKCKSLVFTTVEISNPCQDGINVSICLGIMLKNYHLE